MESRIVVLGFDGQYGAEGMLEQMESFEEQGLITLEDAVVTSRGVGTNIEVKQAHKKHSALKGSGVGLLAGILLGGPILGVAAGAGIGAIMGKAKDSGLDEGFVSGIAESLKPDSSALFLLIKEVKAEEFEGKLNEFGARVLTTSLPIEREKALRDLLGEE